MALERIRLYEEFRHTDAVLKGKRFIPMISILAISLILVGSGIAIAVNFIFGQNIPSHIVSATVKGCTDIIGHIDNLTVDTARGGTGVVFVCPPGNFGPNFYAIQPLSAGSAVWHHDGIGGYNALYLIPSNAIPVEGCHKLIHSDGTPFDPGWAVNITANDGTITFFDTTAFAYCGEYVKFGNYGTFFVSWSQ